MVSHFAATFCFIALSILILVLADDLDRIRYVCVIDAGSTGSRIYVYSFRNDSPLESLRAVGRKRLRPALSSFVNDTTSLTLQLNSLISTAAQWIPAVEHAHTRVSLMATAGLRRLPREQQEAIMQVVYTSLESSSFLHSVGSSDPGSSGVISGQLEATFDFLAVLAAFQPARGALSEELLLGAADLGGSSTQFAFMCPSSAVAGGCGDMHFGPRLGLGSAFAVHARSAPGLGLIEGMEGLMRRYERERLRECTGDEARPGACEGLRLRRAVWGPTQPSDSVLPAWARARSDENNPCIPPDGVPLNTADGEHVVAGSGDFDSCVRLVRHYLIPRARSLLCPEPNVGASSVHEETADPKETACSRNSPRPRFVVGLDNFPKVLEVLRLPPRFVPDGSEGAKVLAALALAPASIADAGRTACLQPWSQLLLTLPAGAHAYRAHRACYGAAFIYLLLTEVYGIPPDSEEFVPLEELEPFGELGWALGAALALATGDAV